ncbi:unnamed protein product [Didymodactylos carnosus]|uniref:Uncharacterized protein n=1 Tax=Didymodactylos carnosus TaxID=1234261 RepID=A0A8S2EH69_9BILA|nr:unnamed protein product [Didymodactylos carnosus]CAF3951642.1 unnamed protein product [Didymodactylos carnosus]
MVTFSVSRNGNLLSELKIKNDQLKTIQKQNNLDYEHVTKTNQQLLNQNKTLEQKIKDVTNGYDRQTERIHELEVNLKKSDERFKVEEEKVNVNVRVKQLEEKLSNANEKLSNLYQEFNAYKLFSNTLLDKERQLNERLQNLFGGASVNRTTKTTEH